MKIVESPRLRKELAALPESIKVRDEKQLISTRGESIL